MYVQVPVSSRISVAEVGEVGKKKQRTITPCRCTPHTRNPSIIESSLGQLEAPARTRVGDQLFPRRDSSRSRYTSIEGPDCKLTRFNEPRDGMRQDKRPVSSLATPIVGYRCRG